MKSYTSLYAKLPYAAKIITITLYIALMNSYALFIIYPSLKSGDVSMGLLSLGVYGILSLPFLYYCKTRLINRLRTRTVLIGLAVMVAATLLQYFISQPSLPVLLTHFAFYLFAGVIEETLWRGKLWNLVSQKLNHPVAVLGVITGHFVVLHIPFALLEKQDPLGFLLQVVALGIALGVLRIISKRVSVPAFAHATINMVVYT